MLLRELNGIAPAKCPAPKRCTVMVDAVLFPGKTQVPEGLGNVKACSCSPRTMGSHWRFEQEGNMIASVTKMVLEDGKCVYRVNRGCVVSVTRWFCGRHNSGLPCGRRGKANKREQ